MMSKTPNEYNSDSQESRRNLFIIIDPYADNNDAIVEQRSGSSLDIPATILGYMNGTDKFGLGANLLNLNGSTFVEIFKEMTNTALKNYSKNFDFIQKKIDEINNEKIKKNFLIRVGPYLKFFFRPPIRIPV